MSFNWLTYKDIEPCLNRLTNNTNISYILEVKDENDIHQLVGLITKISQEWEIEVKALLGTLNIDKNSLAIKGIGDVIAHICNKGIFNVEEAKILRDVVKLRNYVTHHFYLEYANSSYYDLALANNVLNKIYYVISNAKRIVKSKRTIS